MTRRVSRFPARSSRRATEWVAPADQGFINVGAGAKVIHQTFAIDTSQFAPGATIVRTRGMLSVKLQSYAADLDVVGAMGMTVVSDEAVAAGVASIPGPWGAADWEGWFVWEAFGFHFEATAGVDVMGSIQIPFDSKAMRKVSSGQTVVVLVESQQFAFSTAVMFRQLYKPV